MIAPLDQQDGVVVVARDQEMAGSRIVLLGIAAEDLFQGPDRLLVPARGRRAIRSLAGDAAAHVVSRGQGLGIFDDRRMFADQPLVDLDRLLQERLGGAVAPADDEEPGQDGQGPRQLEADLGAIGLDPHHLPPGRDRIREGGLRLIPAVRSHRPAPERIERVRQQIPILDDLRVFGDELSSRRNGLLEALQRLVGSPPAARAGWPGSGSGHPGSGCRGRAARPASGGSRRPRRFTAAACSIRPVP